MSLSARNGWLDKAGRVFIIYTVQEVQDALGCADKKATKLLRELEKYGLIERKRRGLGKPSLIYVKNFSSESSKLRFLNRDNDDSGTVQNMLQEPTTLRCNKTEINNTEMNDTDPIHMESDLRVIADVRAPDHTLEDLQHSAGIALRAGSKMEEIFMNEPEQAITLYACSTYDTAKTAFIKGYVSTLGGHELSLQKVIQEYPGLYHFLDGPLMTIHLRVAFCKTSTAAAFQPLNNALSEMKEDGTIDSIVSRYKAALSEDGEVQLDEKN